MSDKGLRSPELAAALNSRLAAELYPAPAEPTEVDHAAAEAEGHQASEAQQDAGNYQKGHAIIGPQGATLDISIENEAGTSRRPEWPPLKDHYGYVKGSVGFDKDHVDVFIVPGTPANFSGEVWVVNQMKSGADAFDEHKALIGVEHAQRELDMLRTRGAFLPSLPAFVYTRNYEAGWDDFADPVRITWRGFREWVLSGSPRNGPLTEEAAKLWDARGAAAPVQHELSHIDIPNTSARSFEHVVVEMEKQRTVKLPSGRIRNSSDAARAFRQLNRWPRERFQMIGVDAKGRPLAFYDLYAGTLAQTSVHAREVWAALYQTKGVKGVWFAHNHPSGIATPSHADELLTQNLRLMLTPAVGIEYRGHVIIAGDRAVAIGTMEVTDLSQPDEGPMRSVPVLERAIASQKPSTEALTSPQAVRDFLNKLKPTGPGILIMDAQHRVAGWWDMSLEKMQNVGPEPFGRAAADVMRLIGRNNPAAAIIYAPKGSNQHQVTDAANNLRGLFSMVEVKLLDAIVDQGPIEGTGRNGYTSYAERGILRQDEAPYHAPVDAMKVVEGGPESDTLNGWRRFAGVQAKANPNEPAWARLTKWLDTQERVFGGDYRSRITKHRILTVMWGSSFSLRDDDGDRPSFAAAMQFPANKPTAELAAERAKLGPLKVSSTSQEQLLARYEDLERQVDAAYEAGDPRAEDLDAELAQLRDVVTGIGEENLQLSEPDHEGEAELDRLLVTNYREWLDAKTAEDRAYAIERARENVHEAGGEFARATSDEDMLAAMHDAYMAAVERRERVRASYSLDERPGDRGVTVEHVHGELAENELYKRIGGRVNIVQRVYDLPADMVSTIVAMGAMRQVRGVHRDGEIWVVADNLRPGEAETVLVHEAVGHAGVEAVLEGAEGVFADIYAKRKADIQREAREGFLKQYDFDFARPAHQVQAAREWIAHQAEVGEERTLWQTLVAWMREAFRKIGIVRAWSDNDILNLLQLSRSALMHGGEDTFNGRPAFQLGEKAPVWYSALERAVERLDLPRAKAEQWLRTIETRPGVKPDELEWSGLREWLGTLDGETVEKEAIVQYLRANGVRLAETALGRVTDNEGTQRWDDAAVRLHSLGYQVHTDAGHLLAVIRSADDQAYTDSPDELVTPGVDRFINARSYADLPAEERELVGILKAHEAAFAERHNLRFLGSTRYANWQLPGGRNYMELLITAPGQQAYISPHWDQENIVAHVRFNERTDAEGKRVLFVEEIQSDWAERGRKHGFVVPVPKAERAERIAAAEEARGRLDHARVAASEALERNDLLGFDSLALALQAVRLHPNFATSWEVHAADLPALHDYRAATQDVQRTYEATHEFERGIPRGPFVEKTPQWVGLVLKRITRYAVDNGFERVAWTTGDQQAKRYNLEKHINAIAYDEAGQALYIRRRGDALWQREPLARNVAPRELAEYVGADVAARLMAAPLQRHGGVGEPSPMARILHDEQLSVGGDGMRAFYDKIVPNVANDVLKKLGGERVGVVTIETTSERGEAYATFMEQAGYDITEPMRLSVARGIPMFSLRANPPMVREVYGVRDGRLLGMATRVGSGVWTVYLSAGTNASLTAAPGEFRRLQVGSLNQVSRVFNREGLELVVRKPRNIPVPDRTLFDGHWVAPTITSQADDPLGLKLKNWFARATVEFQNRLLLPRKYEETIARALGTVPEEARAHREARLAHPRAAGLIADFTHDYVDQLADGHGNGVMERHKIGLAEAGRYLYARLAPEVNAYVESINPENKAGSGMTNERAAEIMAEFERAGRLPALEELGAIADRISHHREEVMIAKGLAKREFVELIRARYPHYVPLREMAEDGEYINGETGSGYQTHNPIRQRFGRFSEAQSEFILPALVAQAKGTIAAGENAEVTRALIRLVEFAPNPDVWEIDRAFWKPRIDRDTGMVVWAPTPPPRGHGIRVPVDGEWHTIWVRDPALAKAFNESGVTLPDAISFIGSITRFFATMATARNPAFLPTNLARDLQEMLIRVGGENGPKLATQALKDVPAAFWGAFSGLRAEGQYVPGESALPLAENWHAWYRRYIEAGGHVAYRGIQDPEQQHKDFVGTLAKSGIYPESEGVLAGLKHRGMRVAAVTRVEAFYETVSNLNGAIENATRLAVFKNAIEHARMNDKDAAMLARNATVDFNLSGEQRWINQAWMFFNANAQGTALVFRSIYHSRGVRAASAFLLVLGILQQWFNRWWADKDPRTGRSYDEDMGEDIKQRNIVIVGPDRKNAILIPLPFAFGVFHNIGRHLMAVMPKESGGSGESPARAAVQVFIATVNAVSPFGNVPQSWLGSVQLISPTVGDPVVQHMTNRNWTDRPIRPERPRGASPQAASWTYFAGTPDVYVQTAQWLNKITGGNEVRPGALDFYPNVMQHWVQSIFGGAGKTYSQLFVWLGSKAAGKEVEPKDIPILNRFWYEPKDYELSRRFYENVNAAEIAHFEVLRAMQRGDAEGASVMRENFKQERSMYPEAKAVESSVAKLRTEVSKIKKQPGLDDERRKAMVSKLEAQARDLMGGFNARYEKMTE